MRENSVSRFLKTLAVVALGGVANLALLLAPVAALGRMPVALQDPAAIAFLVLATAFFAADALTLYLGATDVTPRCISDWRHHRLALASGLALLAVFWSSLIERSFHTERIFWLGGISGASLMGLGLALRGAAIVTLRQRFVSNIAESGDHPLIRHGVYRWLRHPSEAGLLLVAIGAATLLHSRTGWLFIVPLSVLIALRTRLEDRQLELAQGDSFRRYRETVPGFWPRFGLRVPQSLHFP